METQIDFTIDIKDLKILYLHTKHAYKDMIFDEWVIVAKTSYKEYHSRNLKDLEKYGTPRTFSQWVNQQIISLT